MNAPLSRAALANVQAADLAALPLIEKWIAFATVSRDSNLALLDWTEAYLKDLGIACSRTYDDSGQKANLWATLPAHEHTSIVSAYRPEVDRLPDLVPDFDRAVWPNFGA